MTIQIERPSAKIYQFPVRTRNAPAFRGEQSHAAEATLKSAPLVSYESGWYHEAAIQAERVQQN